MKRDVTRKQTLGASLILSLVASMALMGISQPATADSTVIVSFNPMELEVPVGHNFTIDVNITNIEDIGAFEFFLSYNTTILNATYVNINPPLYPEPTPGWDWLPEDMYGVWHPDGPPTINDAAGTVWVGCLIPTPGPGTGFYGNFTLVSINFTATALGNTTLHLYDVVIGDWEGKLIASTPVDFWDNPLPYDIIEPLDAWINVVPEFPAALVMPLLLITTLAAAFLGKTFWSRKRKERLQKNSPP